MNEATYEELEKLAESLGMRVFADDLDDNEVALYVGDELICYLLYDEDQDGWMDSPFPCGFVPVEELLPSLLEVHQRNKKQNARKTTFTVTIEYGAIAPRPTPEAADALAALVAKSIGRLVPGKPKPKAVIVNEQRHEL